MSRTSVQAWDAAASTRSSRCGSRTRCSSPPRARASRVPCASRASARRGWRSASGSPAGRGLGLGLGGRACANILWSALYGSSDDAPAVSIADALWLAFYPASWLALVLLLRARVSDFRMSIALDGLIGALLLGGACAALLIDPIVHAAGTSTETILVNLAYPMGDAVILAFVLAVFLLTGWRPGRSWLLLVAGFAVNSLGDSYYVHQVAVGAWRDATLLDATFVVAVLLMAGAAWQPDRERP